MMLREKNVSSCSTQFLFGLMGEERKPITICVIHLVTCLSLVLDHEKKKPWRVVDKLFVEHLHLAVLFKVFDWNRKELEIPGAEQSINRFVIFIVSLNEFFLSN